MNECDSKGCKQPAIKTFKGLTYCYFCYLRELQEKKQLKERRKKNV